MSIFTNIQHPLTFTFGILGNIISFMVYLAPAPTFYKIITKKSTEGFQSIPYVVAVFSSMIWIYYHWGQYEEDEVLEADVDKFHSKLSRCKPNNLSLEGRVTLAKAVLSSLPNYYSSLFKVPKSVINSLKHIGRNFVWGFNNRNRKVNWVAWEKMVGPKRI